MQPLLNASKMWYTILVGSLKKLETSRKHPKNKLSLVTEVDESKARLIMKPRRGNNFIVKFQI